MKDELSSIKFKCISYFIGILIFGFLWVFLSEASKAVGGFNIATLLSGMAFFITIVCIISFCFNLMLYHNKKYIDKDKTIINKSGNKSEKEIEN